MNTAPSTDSGNNVLAIVAAIYTILACVFQICAGAGAGLLLNEMNQFRSIGVTVRNGEAAGLMSIILIVVGIAMLFAAVGVFMRRPWSWKLMIGTHAAYAVLMLLTAGLSSIVSIVFIVLSIGVIGLFLTQPDIKRALNVV